MAFNKRTWKGRQGVGLNKFSINGASPVTIVNQPDSVTEQGDALSAGNLNDLEDRIYDAFDDIADGTQIVGKATADASGNVITTTYETKADASDLKSAIDANSKRITNLEQKAGDEIVVDYPSSTYGMDEVPPNVAEYGKVTKLRGVTRVKNNVAPKIEIGSGWDCNPTFGTGVVSDNKIVYTITTQSENQSFRRTTGNGGVVFKANHVSLIFFDLTLSEASDHVRVCYMDTLWTSDVSVLANVKTRCAFIVAPTAVGANTYFAVYPNIINGLSVDATAILENVTVTDLTLYFNGNIPTNAQTIADIQTNYHELLEPSDYNTGSAVFPTYSAVKSQGVNLWDEEAQVGNIDFDNAGNDITDSTRLRSGYIPCLPSTAYYCKCPITDVRFGFYDMDEHYLGSATKIENVGNTSFTTPSGAYFMRFRLASSYGVTYNHDIQICLNSYADKTTYHPYMTDTLTFPSPVTLKGAGNVAEEYYPESGRVTHPIGSVDMATLAWSYNSTYDCYTCTLSDYSGKDGAYICANYANGGARAIENMASAPKGIYNWGKRLQVKDSASPTGTLYFALATPSADTYVDPIPDNFLDVEGGGTIKPVQSQNIKIDHAFTAEYLAV